MSATVAALLVLAAPPFLPDLPPAPARADLPLMLHAAYMADQEARMRMLDAMSDPAKMQTVVRDVQREDAASTRLMMAIVKAYGWPTISMVGAEASNHAWLLVQHADQHPAFQEYCLKLMRTHFESGDVSKSNYAYLYDRVMMNTGRKQRYGTQTRTVNGELVAANLEDPRNVDKRRASVGLGPLDEYLDRIRQLMKGG